jgi:hypothetical protein
MRLRAAVTRFLGEVTRAAPEADAALDALGVRVEGGVAIVVSVSRDSPERAPLGTLREGSVGSVELPGDIYRRVAGRDARVRLLRIAAAATRGDIVVRVPVGAVGTHAARLLVDAPRAAMRRTGLLAAAPGDRFPPEGYLHVFFDEEPLLAEFHDAGLAVSSRRGFTFVLGRRRAADVEHPEPFALELARAAGAARAGERARLHDTPERAIHAMRARGARAPARGPVGRARLRRAIGWIDAATPPPYSCYRRTLLELSLDAGAARETLVFGLDVGKTGHVAFKDREDVAFDVAFEIT